jgi:aspartokinase/homoserine dehydrogenase 1
MGWNVHKFGGTSLADADCYRRVATIVAAQPDASQAVVVSAIGGMTDVLLALVSAASSQAEVAPQLATLRDRYHGIVSELLADRGVPLMDQMERDLADVKSVLTALALVKSASHRSRDLVAGFGELWSARLLTAVLAAQQGRPVMLIDARDVLRVVPSEMGPAVQWEDSKTALAGCLDPHFDGIAVITGFIARTPDGLQTTLGRNGSDFSASIFAALLEAAEINIWTDVEGVMSGDPRRVPEARVIREMSYNEAMELAYFGAKVIHPQTMTPAVEHSIPIRIRSTFNPAGEGTWITAAPRSTDLVKGVSSIEGIALINLEGSGMIGVPGTADRLFGSLREAGISVVLISQGSSEHSICFAVPVESARRVKEVVAGAFAGELAQGQVQNIDVTPDCAILAVVGDGMAGAPGIAGRFFSTLGRAGINVRAIAQGASERNISAVIAAADATRALRAVHASFYLSAKTVSIGLIGPGSVGGVLLDQLAGEAERLAAEFGVDLRVRAIGGSRRMVLADKRIALARWREQVDNSQAMDLDRFVDHVQADHLPHAVLLDCTADQSVAERYEGWLGRGIHVITPNKKAHSGSLEYYHRLKAVTRESGAQFLYETTVGAGLPVVHTLRDLVDTGDEIYTISGIFSGTLAYLFNVYDGSRPFSSIVADAQSKGYTEPDPRADLSGMDVARKTVILAREAGLELELEQLSVQSLVPESLGEGSVEDFLRQLPAHDAAMAARLKVAQEANQVLRYVGELDLRSGTARVHLAPFNTDHAFANISLTDNIVQFVTRRYCDNPLIVRGPGAGPDVTAAGVFADLLRLCARLGGNGG